MKTKHDMTTGTEWKLILFFTIPIMIGNILQQSYNVVDGIIVGNFVGESAFAAVATGGPLTLLFLAIAFGFSVGVSITASQYFGAGKRDELPVVIDTALILLGACGLMLTVVGIIMSPVLLRHVLSVPEHIFDDAVIYMRIYCAGLFFQFMYNCIASMLRGFGDSKATLYFLIISAVLNTLLSYLLVAVIKWGVAGAAIGTIVTQGVSAVVSYRYLRRHYPASATGKHWDAKIAITMVKLGMPIAIQMGLISMGNGAMQRLVNSFGITTPGVVPAYGAAMRVESIVFAPMSALQAGLASFTGQNIGAGKLDRVRRGLRSALTMSLTITFVLSIIYYLFADNIVGLFGLAGDSKIIGAEIARYFAWFFLILAANLMFSGLLQGAGDTLIITIASLTSLSLRVVAGYLLAHFNVLGYSAAWVPVPFGWMCWSAVIYTRYFSGKWKNKAVAGKLSKSEASVEGTLP